MEDLIVDLSNTPNPYDFSNPVSDEDLFIGRKKEIEEIEYYLNHAKTAKRPINVAIIGQRASGKTSLLNMTEIKAANKGFCTARIDLDEGDADSQLNLFCKLFNGILVASLEDGAYGGKKSETFYTYIDMISSYEIPDKKD